MIRRRYEKKRGMRQLCALQDDDRSGLFLYCRRGGVRHNVPGSRTVADAAGEATMTIVANKPGEAFPGLIGCTMGFRTAGLIRPPDQDAESRRACGCRPAS
jgi:hypothetical protein